MVPDSDLIGKTISSICDLPFQMAYRYALTCPKFFSRGQSCLLLNQGLIRGCERGLCSRGTEACDRVLAWPKEAPFHRQQGGSGQSQKPRDSLTDWVGNAGQVPEEEKMS